MMTNIPEKKEQPRKITFFFTISLHEPYHWLNAPAARKEREKKKAVNKKSLLTHDRDKASITISMHLQELTPCREARHY